jgi:nicotinate-nucleotide adenylyltransferase
MRIALFGGSFDPPHLGHFQIALHILEEELADQVWFVPVKNHPFGKKMTADVYRIEMLQRLLDDGRETLKTKKLPATALKVNTYEIEREEVSFSFNTLEHFAKENPADSFSWIIGSDNLTSFHKWYKAEELLEKYPVFVYPRLKFPFQPLMTGMIPLLKMPEIDISSTDIRQKISLGLSIRELVSPRQEKMISNQHFYKKAKDNTNNKTD